jgi:YHS domain-containing protein
MAMEKDPVCGMDVDPGKSQQKAEYQGNTYYFCGPGCRKAFEADPDKFFDPAYKPSMGPR